MSYAESNYENAVIQLLSEELGYSYVYGPDVERDYHSPLYEEVLLASLQRINPQLPMEAVNEAVDRLRNFERGTLLQKNIIFMDYLQNGMEVKFHEDGKERHGQIYLIDYTNPGNNDFIVANQWTMVENSEKRLDIVLFVNGLPLAAVELKSPSREETDTSAAFLQLQNYMREIPSFFIYNAVCVISDMAVSKAGTITSEESRFMEWKTTDGSYENTACAQFHVFFEGLFEKNRFLDILKNFICFHMNGEKTFKILAGYHQYFAVKKAVASTLNATVTDGKAGVFWHTQGSGKSLSMIFYVHALQVVLESPTIVVVTDRNDLDEQLYRQFMHCRDFLRQTPQQAQSRQHLRELLANRRANGIIFTTMQKFEEGDSALSQRHNIVVMADEAHRGQYGLSEKVVVRQKGNGEVEAHTRIGTARVIRDSLPNAVYIGFTGTPIFSKDRSTQEVFGDYIDIYDMTQAVEDNATCPVYYESRVIHLKLDENSLSFMDAEYDLMARNADPYVIEKSKETLARMEAVLGAKQVIQSLVDDILKHYENYREHLLTGKAMIVAGSRRTAMKIYRQILELRPAWTEKIAIVMTQNDKDSEEWRKIIGNKVHREELARKFKDDNSSLKIVIVVDMWLTGFDVPSLATMYVYKPMSGHNLMQAIARVNRVFPEKEGGLIVDYVGIAKALKEAMSNYTSRDKKNYGDVDISRTAYIKFLEKLSVCRDLLHNFDYSDFFTGTDLERGKAISGGINFLLGRQTIEKDLPAKEKTYNIYKKEALLLKQAFSLCSSLACERERLECAYFEAVRIMMVRLAVDGAGKKFTLPEINERMNEFLRQSIKSEGVINLFSDGKTSCSLFDLKFLEEVAEMKEKNLAVELLRKLIAEQVAIYRRKNIVKSEKFSEMIQGVMNRYLNGMLTNEEVIEELLKLAKDMTAAEAESERLGLSAEESAFYDALTKPQAIQDFYRHGELIALTKELTDSLQKNRTIDWQKKESARAGMRRMVKRLLKKYKYPPEGMEDAVQTVMKQCEVWADNSC